MMPSTKPSTWKLRWAVTKADLRSPRLNAMRRFMREVEALFPDPRTQDYLRYAFLTGWHRRREHDRRKAKREADRD